MAPHHWGARLGVWTRPQPSQPLHRGGGAGRALGSSRLLGCCAPVRRCWHRSACTGAPPHPSLPSSCASLPPLRPTPPAHGWWATREAGIAPVALRRASSEDGGPVVHSAASEARRCCACSATSNMEERRTRPVSSVLPPPATWTLCLACRVAPPAAAAAAEGPPTDSELRRPAVFQRELAAANRSVCSDTLVASDSAMWALAPAKLGSANRGWRGQHFTKVRSASHTHTRTYWIIKPSVAS